MGINAKQIHNFYGWNEIQINKKAPYSIKAKNCYLCEKETYGEVVLSEEECKEHPEYMSDYGTFKWNLKIDKKIAFNVGYGAGKLFRSLQAFEMF